MSNENLVIKVVRTLPKKFVYKVTAIEEAQDLITVSVDELIGNLTTFEMSLDDRESSKKKGISLKVSSEDVNDQDLVETMNLLVKNINKPLKRFNKKPFSGSVIPHVTYRSNNRWKKPVKQGNYGIGVTKPTVIDTVDDNNEDEDDMIRRVA
ncbi:hypothetical protein LIER_34029 [Lithospermum erythrorhizon]|uniref:Uncharacterized protein n=1 Tax=Lithospermum erythrorhizon TaxID=34254 RepID=A0AAV3RYC1_LITER